MYAVIATGGKQYRVEQGDIILVEKLPQEPEELVDFEQVLLVSDGNGTKIGDPVLSGAKVTAKVLEQGKGPKVRGMRYRAKKITAVVMGTGSAILRLRSKIFWFKP